MPVHLDPNRSSTIKHERDLLNASYEYDYPGGLDLKPGSDDHDAIVAMIQDRARESFEVMEKRHDEWRSIDKVLRAYVPDKRTNTSKDDTLDDMPAIVIPQSYATLETIMTYMTKAFIRPPIFNYEGVAPEDVLGSILMTHLVEQQNLRFGNGLALHTQFRDAFAYGIGVVSPVWEQVQGYKIERKQRGFIDFVNNIFFKTGTDASEEWATLYEGNKVINIDPYKYLPDPSVASHEVQMGEYCGYQDRTNIKSLLARERLEEDFIFNAKYLRHIDGRSNLLNDSRENSKERATEHLSTINPVDVIWMYVDLIPSDWKLGTSDYPEKWMFGLAGGKVIIAAHPLGLSHQQYPFAVCSPDFDGYSANPASRLGIVHDMQVLGDFLYSSHIQNTMKAINDMFVADPYLIHLPDMQDTKPGKIIRIRRAGWGKGAIKDSIMQFPVSDVTQTHVQDSLLLGSQMQNATGATDSVAGIMGNRTSRISAAEFQGVKSSSLSRLEKAAVIISMQSMQPLGRMMASQTQQFMSSDTYIKVVGELEEQLREEFGRPVNNQRAAVALQDIAVNFDINAHDGVIPGSANVETLVSLYQMALQNPQAAQELDTFKLFQTIAREAGVKNIHDFKRKVEVQPDEQVEQQIQQGNLRPVA